jgi:hypothetical protein
MKMVVLRPRVSRRYKAGSGLRAMRGVCGFWGAWMQLLERLGTGKGLLLRQGYGRSFNQLYIRDR